MRCFKLKVMAVTFLMCSVLHAPYLRAADIPLTQPSEGAKPAALVPILNQKTFLIPNTTETAMLNLYSNGNVVVQVLSEQTSLISEAEFKTDNAGQFHWVNSKNELLADLQVEASDDQKWYAEGLLKQADLKTVSNQIISFDRLKVKMPRHENSPLMEGLIESTERRLKLPWSVMGGLSSNAGVTLYFKALGEQLEKNDFLLKAHPNGERAFHYHVPKRHFLLEGNPEHHHTTLSFEYQFNEPGNVESLIKLQVIQVGDSIALKLQEYPVGGAERKEHYKELQIDFNFASHAFSSAEFKTFVLQGEEYVIQDRKSLALEKDFVNLPTTVADLLNNRDKILGQTGINAPPELVDLVSLLDPSTKESIQRDGFLKHIATFMVKVHDEKSRLQSDLFSTSMQTVLFDQGFAPLIRFLNDFYQYFEASLKLYEQADQKEFKEARYNIIQKMRAENPQALLPEHLQPIQIHIPQEVQADLDRVEDIPLVALPAESLPAAPAQIAVTAATIVAPSEPGSSPKIEPEVVNPRAEINSPSKEDLPIHGEMTKTIQDHSGHVARQELKPKVKKTLKELISTKAPEPKLDQNSSQLKFEDPIPEQYEVKQRKFKRPAFEAFRVTSS